MYIQKEPICVYWKRYETETELVYDSELFFHSDCPHYTFNEFLLYIVIPYIEDLQEEKHTVQWGYVNATPERDLDDYKNFLEKEIRYEKQGDSAAN